jgi:hypothetical protein
MSGSGQFKKNLILREYCRLKFRPDPRTVPHVWHVFISSLTFLAGVQVLLKYGHESMFFDTNEMLCFSVITNRTGHKFVP